MTDAIFAVRPNLLVAKLVTSVEFYERQLGFHVGWRWSDPLGRFLTEDEPLVDPGTALVGRDQAQIILTQRDAERGTWLHLDVHTPDQVDALYAEWRDRGNRDRRAAGGAGLGHVRDARDRSGRACPAGELAAAVSRGGGGNVG